MTTAHYLANLSNLGTHRLAGAIMAALYPMGTALAQPADEAGAGEIEEVIVTATKRSVNLQDVPQSITAFTTLQIEKNAFKDMMSYVRALPSVTLINSQPGRNELVFRGVATGVGQYRTDSQVAVYLDEQPLTTNSQQVSPYMVDIERVESLPGPQGTLFGSSSQTGTMRIITNKPNPDGFAGQAFGEFRVVDSGDPGYEANAWVNIPLADNKMALRLVAYGSNDGGYVDNVLGDDLVHLRDNSDVVEKNFNEYNLVGGRAALKVDLSDKLEVLAAFITESTKADGTWDSDPYLGANKVTKFIDEFRDDKWWQAALTLTAELSFADLISNTAYFHRDIQYEWDNMTYGEWKDSYYGYYNGYDLYNTQYTENNIFNDQKQHRFSQEIRLVSNSDSRFQWMAGFFYEDVYDEWFYGADNPELMNTIAWEAANYYAYYYHNLGYDVEYPLAPTTIGYSNLFKRTIKQTAFFGEISYNLTDAWKVTGGARWFQYKRDVYEQNQFPQGLPPAGSYDTNGAYGAKGTEGKTVFKFSTEYNFTEDKMAYFLFSQGFRLGGTNSQRAANYSPDDPIYLNYQPDTMNNWEVGLKSEWLDNKLVFNIDFFLMQWDNIQWVDGSVGAWWLNGTLNGETAEQKGVEMNIEWQVTDELSFTGSATFTNPEFTEAFELTDGTILPKGTPMPISPEQALWGAVEYNFSQWKPFGGELWVRYDQNYQGSKYNNVTNAIDGTDYGKIPSWSIANFQVGLNLEESQWDLTFFIRNVWNAKAWTWLGTGGNYEPEWFGDPRFQNDRTYLPPRTIGINARYSF